MAISRERDLLGTGWAFPVRVNPRGGFSWSRGPEDVQEAIWILLGTAPGERPMRPDFGCGIHGLVFAPNSPATRGAVAEQVRLALTRYEPRIDLSEVRVEAVPEEPARLLIRVDYRVRATNASHSLVYPFYLSEGRGG
ncbi:MAG TPA: GPW/gp25 family protein [Thermoanaerobaculia bacterium]|nr:GPW/gp25 family protein [Thermoanaerobaculia bacterium]